MENNQTYDEYLKAAVRVIFRNALRSAGFDPMRERSTEDMARIAAVIEAPLIKESRRWWSMAETREDIEAEDKRLFQDAASAARLLWMEAMESLECKNIS